MSNTIESRPYPQMMNPFNKKWMMSANGAYMLAKIFKEKTFFDQFTYLFQNPSDFFVGIRAYPFNLIKYFNYEPAISQVYMGNVALTVDGKNLKAHDFPYGNFYRHMGTIKIERKFNNFLDYAPYTKLELYIPYCSIVTLDTNVVMGSEIRLFYSVDWDTGECTCYIIKHIDGTEERDGELIMTVDGKIGFDLPFGTTNANDIAKKLSTSTVGMVGGIVTGIVTKSPKLILGSLAVGGHALMSTEEQYVSKGGSARGTACLVSPNKAYLIRTTPKVVNHQSDYASYKGLPLNKNVKLSTLTGFTKVGDIHLEQLGIATRPELDEIEKALTDGVILPLHI